jgi:hypothetical protein
MPLSCQQCYNGTVTGNCPGCTACGSEDNECVADDDNCPDYSSCCGGGGGGCDQCVEENQDCSECDCCDGSCNNGRCESEDPIVIDLNGAGFQLTNAKNGVKFDFFGTGSPIQIPWTAAGSDTAWLALDRNNDGRIDNGADLFSNVAPQPAAAPQLKIGFKALAVYDLPANGGNGDGIIDRRDAVFSKLLVWVDRNHNGISDPGELMTMQHAVLRSPVRRGAGNGFLGRAGAMTGFTGSNAGTKSDN